VSSQRCDGASPVTFDVYLAVTDRGEHVLYRVRGHEGLSETCRRFESVERKDFLRGFEEGISGGLVDAPQPFLMVVKHLSCIAIAILLQGGHESPVRLLSVLLYKDR